MIKRLLVMAAGLLLLAGCAAKKSTTEITISAAASLQTSLTEVAKQYETVHSEIKINLDFAGSGTIREKVIAGAPIDGLILASQSDIKKLGNKVENSTAVLGNSLVLISNKKSTLSLSNSSDLPSFLKSANKIAIGNPDSVPAGSYVKQALTHLGLYDSLQAKFVQGSDVTQVLSYVAAGNADLGFVYQTDARSSSQVKVLTTLADNTHDKIAYYTADVTTSKNFSTTERFNKYLLSSDAQKIFKKYGFITQ